MSWMWHVGFFVLMPASWALVVWAWRQEGVR
jgi:hypothetical protein